MVDCYDPTASNDDASPLERLVAVWERDKRAKESFGNVCETFKPAV